MGFIIKDVIENNEEKKVMTFYTGTDGFVHDFPEYARPYKRRADAVRKIRKNIEWYGNKISDTECVESNRWHHSFEIVEVAIDD